MNAPQALQAMEAVLSMMRLSTEFDMNSISNFLLLPWSKSLDTNDDESDTNLFLPNTTAPAPLWTSVQKYDGYEVSRQGSTVRLRLDRIHHGNSLTITTMKDITSLFKKLSADDSVHRIVITGRGRYFCTGMDLKEDLFTSAADRYTVLHDLFSAIDTCPKPTIAVVNGPAFGGGVGLATVCDVRIALSTAYFCLSEVKLGLCPATIAKYLVREWGVGLARMAMVTGRRISSQVLYDAGIIHALALDVDSLEASMWGFLDDMRFAAPQAAALTKTLVRETARGDEVTSDQVAREIFEAMLTPGSEAAHGVSQFKRGIKNIVWEELNNERGSA